MSFSRLSSVEIADATTLSMLLHKSLMPQIDELVANLANPERQLVKMCRLPRVCVEDIGANHDLMSELIGWDKDESLAKPLLVQLSFWLLDKAHTFQLSAQRQASERAEMHRFEADKTRLVYAYSPACC